MLYKKHLLLILFFIPGIYPCWAQYISHPVIGEDQDIREKLILSTDRTLYFSGENIWFKGHCVIPGTSTDASLSTVLYLELYDRNNKPAVRKKVSLVNGIGTGSIEIPVNTITGNYYLRAYTQYMRNFKEASFYTSELTIINPDLPATTRIEAIKKDSLVQVPDNVLEIITPKTLFAPGDSVTLEIKGEKNSDLSVSIAKKGSYEQARTGINRYFKPNTIPDTLPKTNWYPEIRSVSISGKVEDKKNGEPLKDVLVYASITDSSKQFHLTRTKEDGTFIFALPHLQENHTVYISTQKQPDREVNVLINSDFDTRYPDADYLPEEIDSTRVHLINEMFLSQQVSEVFHNYVSEIRSSIKPLPDPFNEKSKTILLRDYVALPTMIEVFEELVPYTKVKNKNSNPILQMFDMKSKVPYTQPLVLLDYIPFQDHSKLLKLSPSKITSIEVIAEPYVYGGERIFGIINIKSTSGNLAGLELPKEVFAVDYVTLSATESYPNPGLKGTDPLNRAPEFRNTMYWNSSVLLKNGKQTLQFQASDQSGEYDIILRGITEKGNLVFKSKTIAIGKLEQ